jgi:pimeloyl-ACP methyl ester carboxylesterase
MTLDSITTSRDIPHPDPAPEPLGDPIAAHAADESSAPAAGLPEWNEPAGLTARGTLIVLTGRGEAAGVYERFGRRLSADSYRVRVVEDATRDIAVARSQVSALLADDALPEPKVLIGSDSGAALAAVILAESGAGIAGAVLVGLPAVTTGASVTELDAPVDDAELRSACPLHRRTLADPTLVTAGALTRPLPRELADALAGALAHLGSGTVPLLAVHGEADAVSPVTTALDAYRSLAGAQILTISGGRHDALNDVSHRSVAAAVVQFLERVRLAEPGSETELPLVLRDASVRRA